MDFGDLIKSYLGKQQPTSSPHGEQSLSPRARREALIAGMDLHNSFLALAKDTELESKYSRGQAERIWKKLEGEPELFQPIVEILLNREEPFDTLGRFSSLLEYRTLPKGTLLTLLSKLVEIKDEVIFDRVVDVAYEKKGPFKWFGDIILSPNSVKEAVQRVRQVVEKHRELSREAHFSCYSFDIIELILERSKEPQHDLKICTDSASKPQGLTLEALRKYYDEGHKYIGHPEHFGLYGHEFKDKERLSDENLLVRSLMAKLGHYPPLSRHGELVSALLEAPLDARPHLVTLLGHLTKHGIDDRFFRAAVRACVQAGLSTNEIKAVSTTFTQLEKESAISACSILEELSEFGGEVMREAIPRLQPDKLPALEVEIFQRKLRAHQERHPEKPLKEVYQAFLKPEFTDSEIVPEDALLRATALYQRIEKRGRELVGMSKSRFEHSITELLRDTPQSSRHQESFREEYFALAREAFKREYGVYPYNTQLLAVLLLSDEILLHSEDGSPAKGVYAQIKTGEGKSLIFALLASYQAIRGQSVEVITSNNYLAQRDASRFAPFLKNLGLECDSFNYERKREKSVALPRAQILYTTNQSMIFGQLSASLNGIRFMAGRARECVLVDEADNLCIDLTDESCRIATPTTRLVSEDLLKGILSFVDARGKELIFKDIPGAIADLQAILPEARELDPIVVRLYLSSAIRSAELKEDEDYVIRDKKIFIVDVENTGRIRDRTQWSNGLHEFVAIRNKLPLPAPMGVVAYMSHPTFLRGYDRIIGISGTFGGMVDRNEMKDVYGLIGFDTPTHYVNKRHDSPAVICSSKEKKLQLINNWIDELTGNGSKRPVLLVTASIHESEELHNALRSRGIRVQLLNDKSNIDEHGLGKDEDQLIALAGQPGLVTVATSVAGRGADIIPTADAIKAGGVHVILTFIPHNKRVEYQARGRAGRQGSPGSSEIITSIDEDPFLQMLPTGSDNVIQSILDSYGPNSPEVQRSIEYCRVALNTLGSIRRIARLKNEELAQAAMNGYFQSLAKSAKTLATKNVLIATNAGLGQALVSSFMQEEWGRLFQRFNDTIEHGSFLDDATTENEDAKIFVEELERSFHELFISAPDLTDSDRTLAGLMLPIHRAFRLHAHLATQAAKRINEEKITQMLQELQQSVEKLAADSVTKFQRMNKYQIQEYFKNLGKSKEKPSQDE